MQIKYKSFFDTKDFGKIYKKTIIPRVFYLDIKSPFCVQYELTSGCNQKCIFCYNVWKEGCKQSKEESLTKEEQIKVIDKLIENEVFEIIFSGGEPLLVEWLDELIKKASGNKIGTTIITNGISLNEDKSIKLKIAGLKTMQISLHHYNEKVNDKLTSQNGSFKKTVEGIKNAINIFGKEAINVNMVALPETYKDVYKMAEFLHSIGISSFSVATPAATGNMGKNKSMVINKKMFLEIYEQLKLAKKDFGMYVGFTGGFPLCILPKIDTETTNMIGNYCDAGLNQLVIDPKGNIRPCVCLNKNLGNILKNDFKEIWSKNKFLINIRKLKYTPKDCLRCKYVSVCRGGCRASANGYYGKINAKDPLMC